MKKVLYRVKKGERAVQIAQKFNVPVSVLIKTNGLCSELVGGEILVIPKIEGRLYFVRPHQTAEGVACSLGVDKEVLLKQNGVDYLYYGQTIII